MTEFGIYSLDSLSDIYTSIRLLFAKLDQGIAFRIDKIRKQQLKMQRISQIENELEEKIATIENISQTFSSNEREQLKNYKVQLQMTLNQIRGR